MDIVRETRPGHTEKCDCHLYKMNSSYAWLTIFSQLDMFHSEHSQQLHIQYDGLNKRAHFGAAASEPSHQRKKIWSGVQSNICRSCSHWKKNRIKSCVQCQVERRRRWRRCSPFTYTHIKKAGFLFHHHLLFWVLVATLKYNVTNVLLQLMINPLWINSPLHLILTSHVTYIKTWVSKI